MYNFKSHGFVIHIFFFFSSLGTFLDRCFQKQIFFHRENSPVSSLPCICVLFNVDFCCRIYALLVFSLVFVAHLIDSYFLFCFFYLCEINRNCSFFLVFVLTEITNRLCFQSKHISALRIQFRLVDNTNVENCPRWIRPIED